MSDSSAKPWLPEGHFVIGGAWGLQLDTACLGATFKSRTTSHDLESGIPQRARPQRNCRQLVIRRNAFEWSRPHGALRFSSNRPGRKGASCRMGTAARAHAAPLSGGRYDSSAGMVVGGGVGHFKTRQLIVWLSGLSGSAVAIQSPHAIPPPATCGPSCR